MEILWDGRAAEKTEDHQTPIAPHLSAKCRGVTSFNAKVWQSANAEQTETFSFRVMGTLAKLLVKQYSVVRRFALNQYSFTLLI